MPEIYQGLFKGFFTHTPNSMMLTFVIEEDHPILQVEGGEVGRQFFKKGREVGVEVSVNPAPANREDAVEFSGKLSPNWKRRRSLLIYEGEGKTHARISVPRKIFGGKFPYLMRAHLYFQVVWDPNDDNGKVFSFRAALSFVSLRAALNRFNNSGPWNGTFEARDNIYPYNRTETSRPLVDMSMGDPEKPNNLPTLLTTEPHNLRRLTEVGPDLWMVSHHTASEQRAHSRDNSADGPGTFEEITLIYNLGKKND